MADPVQLTTEKQIKRPKAPKSASDMADAKSLAEIALDARLKRAMGMPTDPLEESLLP